MHSAFILVSDRVSNGEKQDKITPIVGERLAAGRRAVASAVTIPEGFDTVSEAIRQALADGARVILTAGGTGLKPRNRTPEAALEFIDTRLEGLERHILVQGLQSTKLAGLSRGYVGLTSRNADAAPHYQRPPAPSAESPTSWTSSVPSWITYGKAWLDRFYSDCVKLAKRF